MTFNTISNNSQINVDTKIINKGFLILDELFQKHKNSCEDFVEEFIQRVFNSGNMRFDIGENDDFRDICIKATYILPVLKYIGEYEEANYGERTYNHFDSLAKTLNLYALIWAYENRQMFENIYKEKEMS
jgi:hypothetical protein